MSIQAKVNYEDVVHRFDMMINLTKNFEPVLNKILGDKDSDKPWTLRGGAKFSFENEVSPPNNSRFKKLTKPYAKWKEKNFAGSMPILHLTGHLYESLVTANADSVVITTDKKLTYGTKTIYAAVHQYGFEKKNIPARPYLGFRKGQRERIDLEVRKYIVDVFKRKQAIESGGL